MRKILVFVLSVIMIFSATACGPSELKTDSSVSCEGFSIKFSAQTDSQKTLEATTEELDWNALGEAGYKNVKITVSYKVSFEKQWSLGSIGYLGNPRYDLSIMSSEGELKKFTSLETKTEKKSVTQSCTVKLEELENSKISIKLETTNIQNLISFEDVEVRYTAEK